MEYCPFCGAPLERGGGGGGLASDLSWRVARRQTLAAGDLVAGEVREYSRARAAQKQRVSDVQTTAGWVVGSMLLLWLSGFIWALLVWNTDPLVIMLVVGLVIGIILWAVLMYQSQQLLWDIEKVKGRDLDGDGYKGRPPGGLRMLFDGSRATKKQMTLVQQWENLPADAQRRDLLKFAAVVLSRQLAKRSIGQKYFRNYTLPSGLKMHDDLHEYLFLRLVEAEVAYQHGRGFRLFDRPDILEDLGRVVRVVEV